MDRNEELGNLAADVSGPKWPLCCTSAQLSSIRRASLQQQHILTSLCSLHFFFVPTIAVIQGSVIVRQDLCSHYMHPDPRQKSQQKTLAWWVEEDGASERHGRVLAREGRVKARGMTEGDGAPRLPGEGVPKIFIIQAANQVCKIRTLQKQ